MISGSLRSTCSRSLLIQRRFLNVLGIETSCDDTSVAIVNDDKCILSSLRFTDRSEQRSRGGICPASVAKQHNLHLPRLIEECTTEAGCSFDDIDAIAVTTRPGLVIALKEGMKKAIELARSHHKPLVPVHHMRAHALSAFLVSNELEFPFISLLISGGHSLVVLCRSVDDFVILGKSVSGSAGECLDKIARELKVPEMEEFHSIHPGAAMEILARRASSDGHLRYCVGGPSVNGADMNFSQLKSSLLNLARKSMSREDFSLEDFCASTQHHVTRHIVARLNAALDHVRTREMWPEIRHVVVSGGVAANSYIANGVTKLCSHYGLSVVCVPPSLCTDNAEMIAWTAIMKIQNKSSDIIKPSEIPDSLYVHARFDIGSDERSTVPIRAENKLSGASVHGDLPIKLINKASFKVALNAEDDQK